MAQSALTVTPPSPTPPTNMSCTGATPPNVPNFTKATYADWLDNTKFDSAPPPYFDDGAAGPVGTFAANTAALASGTAGTAGGTENTYPGATGGVVPASTSIPHEGAGSELSVTNPGNISHTYVVGTMDTSKAYSTGLTLPTPSSANAGVPVNPNASHASSLSPTTNPAFASLTVGSAVSGAGTTLLTCTGTAFVPGCRIWVNNVEQTTTFVSATSITATINKKREAGTWPVDVKLGGVAVPSTRTITWT
jgi:hypothetical protein